MRALLVLLILSLGAFGLLLTARWEAGRAWRRELVAYRLGMPRDMTADGVAAWLSHVVATTQAPRLGMLSPPSVAVEVTATQRGIQHVLLVPERTAGAVLAGLRAALPGVRFDRADTYLDERPTLRIAAEARLTNLMRPLAHERSQAASSALLASMSPLGAGETVVLQWVFVGSARPRPVTAQSTSGPVGLLGTTAKPDPEAIAAARRKQADPLLAAVVRLGVTGATPARTMTVFGWVWGCLRGLNAPGVAVVRRLLPSELVAERLTRLAVPVMAWPMILGTRELAGLLGFPLGGTAVAGLPTGGARHLPPPEAMATHGSIVGVSTYPGMTERLLALKTADRLRHIWVIGPTGVGKSTLLAGQIVGDLQAGRGVAVIDPKGGDLIQAVLERVPDDRVDDVLVIDPSRTDRVVGLNLLNLGRGEHAEELAVDHLVHLMSSLWRGSWGPRTSDLLRQALLALTATRAADGSRFTLVEVPELLLNPTFRRFVISQPSLSPAVRNFWLAYEAMSDGEQAQVAGPSLNKLRALTTRSALRLMLGQSAGVRLDEVFTRRRILLVALPAGVIGSDTAALIGSIVMAGLWQATLARVAVPAERRHPVMIYLDEFQSIVRLPVDLADMLAQARGMGVGLVLAHQYLAQLSDDVRTAVLGTARTQIAFQLEHDDAKSLAPRFAPLTAADLSSLAAFEIAMRPCVNGTTLAPVTGRTLPLPPASRDGAALAAAARARFGQARADIEAATAARIGGTARQRTGRQVMGERS